MKQEIICMTRKNKLTKSLILLNLIKKRRVDKVDSNYTDMHLDSYANCFQILLFVVQAQTSDVGGL